jgi:4-amino-4-deoxy-L-arabinose transferase-like glycosyltransferase
VPGRRTVAVAGGLALLFLASRLAFLTRLPIFLDETGHIRWAVFISEGDKLFRPWNYGKGLSIWTNALLFPWAFDHYLWASRALHVAFGLASMLAAMAAARRLFDARTAALAGLFYVVCPYALFYDRLALTDPPMAAFAALLLLQSIRLAERPDAWTAASVAGLLAAAVLTKATALILFYVPCAAVLLLGPPTRRHLKALAAALLLGAAVVGYPLLRFFATTSTVRLGVTHQDAGLLERLAVNLPLAASWLFAYATPSLALLALAGAARAAAGREKPELLLTALVLLPVLAFSAVSTLWFPRYLVMVVVPLVLLAARGFATLTARLPPGLLALAVAAALGPPLVAGWTIVADPARAPLPAVDREQFVLGWPSGYATVETVAFVRDELRRQPAGLTVVAHVHSRRTTWLALGLEFAHEPRVDLRDLDLTRPGAVDLLASWARARPTVLVVSPVGPAKAPPDPERWQALGSRVLRACKPDGRACDDVYRLDAPRRGL